MNDFDYELALDDLDEAPAYKTSDARRARVTEVRRQQRHRLMEYERSRAHGAHAGAVIPSMNEMIAELRRLSMGYAPHAMGTGIMPRIATFDAARPCTWEPAAAQLARLGISWSELTALAELRPRRGMP